MRRRGSGSISLRPDGRHHVQAWVDGRRRSLGVHDTREEAQAILDGVNAELFDGDQVEGVTLRKWGEQALERRELQGLRSVDRERSCWGAHVAGAELADLPVRAIVRADVQRWVDRLVSTRTRGSRRRRGQNISRRTAGNALTVLRAVLEDALARGVAKLNAAADVKLPRSSGRTRNEWTYLDLVEQGKLLDVVPAALRPAVQFAIFTGLRQGEQWALELADVHHEGETPHVVVRFGSPGKPTKSGEPRVVDLLPGAVEAVRAQLELLAAANKRARGKGRDANPHKVLFPSLRGTRRQRGAPKGWEEWVARAELGRGVRWHDLRHTCASSLVAGWWGRAWTLNEVRALLGHSTIKVTERYAHLAGTLTENAVRETREAVSISSANGVLEKAVFYRSRLRDLNSRPTVYETEQGSSDVASLPPPSAYALAVRALELFVAGDPLAVGALVDVAAAVLERPAIVEVAS